MLEKIKKLMLYLGLSFVIVLFYALYVDYYVPSLYKIQGVSNLIDDFNHFEDQNILLKKFEKKSFLKKINKNNTDFWFHYIILLFRTGNVEKAKLLLSEYVKYDLKRLKNHLYLSHLAVQIGIKDKEIKKSAELFSKIEEHRVNQTLKKLLQDKTIAIVGNGKFEIGKNMGDEIDAHDIVIRFNNYTLDGYEKDYGKKTDIWIWGFGDEFIEDKTNDNEFLFSAMSGDYTYLPIFYDTKLDILYRDIVEKKINAGILDPNLYSEFRYKYSIDPSSGLFMIYTLLKYNLDFDVYGFSFLGEDTNVDYTEHYYSWKDESLIPFQPHNIKKEMRLLKSWFDGRKPKKDIKFL